MSVKYYIIDVEILFSRAPFLKDNTEEFSYVKPKMTIQRQVEVGEGSRSIMNIDMPDELKN